MSTPIYKGNCDNQIQPDGVKTCADTVTSSFSIKGKKTTLSMLQDSTYARGSTYDTNWIILSTELRDLPGYMAKLAINLVAKGTSTESYPDALETTWEINWQSVEKPLTANPKCKLYGEYAGVQGDANETLRQEIVDEVSAWKDSPQQRKRKYQIPLSTLTKEANPLNDADWADVSAAAKAFCQKLAAGIEGYLVFSPVITKTSKYSVKPNTGGCGKIETLSVNISDYVYLKNGDRAIQNQDKTWSRTETWQGADSWDTDLYEAAT